MSFLRQFNIAFALIVQLTCAPGAADTLRAIEPGCQGTHVISIEAAATSDTGHACVGISRATDFLSSQGFTIPAITIKIVDVMPLNGDRREDILHHYPYDEDWTQYPAILFLSDQVAFGAHAYRHFQRHENGQQFIRKILDGKAFGVDE